MTVIGIIGKTFQDAANTSKLTIHPSACGNGKTTTNVHLLYQEFVQKDRMVITNFHTRYPGADPGKPSWSKYMTSQEIFDLWLDVEEGDPEYGAIIGLTEVSGLMNSAGRQGKIITYVEKCLNQRRKNGWDVVWDAQDLGSNDKRWRDKTDYIYRPVKYHCEYSPEMECFRPTEPCPLDNCEEKHQIMVYIEQSPFPLSLQDLVNPQLILNAWEIGQLFYTREKMKDTLSLNPKWG
jgi:hypothetical protein